MSTLKWAVALIAAGVVWLLWQTHSQQSVTHLVNPAYETAGYPFSESVAADGWVFLSGSVGTQPGTSGLVAGGIGPETRQTMDNIRAALERRGLGMDSIVKCTAMLADMAEWPAFNDVYATYFDKNYPARSAFGTSGLALDARVEIECIAKQ